MIHNKVTYDNYTIILLSKSFVIPIYKVEWLLLDNMYM